MLSKIYSAAISGIEGKVITCETDIASGMPNFSIVGHADNSIKEAKDRIRAAIINSGFEYPKNRITVNLSPAGIRKRGSHFDLALALGILASSGQLKMDALKDYCVIGELSLDGTLNKTDGVLPMVIAIRNKGIKNVIIPSKNKEEASLVKGINIFVADRIEEIIDCFNYGRILKSVSFNNKKEEKPGNKNSLDFKDVKGQEFAKRAITIAVAGGHGIFMMGSPSTGKTMLAERIPSIMPKMNYEEILESTVVHSISGLLDDRNPYISERPFRRPHHKITSAAFLGGGAYPVPGEISLASKGVLFLDELGEFDRSIIETLRVPLETKRIVLNRRGNTYLFPADFLLVAASNPCKCGYYNDPTHSCKCTNSEIMRYQKKISGPILDRIDINIALTPVKYGDYISEKVQSSDDMRKVIDNARKIQKERFKDEDITLNSQMDEGQIEKYVSLDDSTKLFLNKAYDALRLNPRTLQKIKKIARTIADIEGDEIVTINHFTESIRYRGESTWMGY